MTLTTASLTERVLGYSDASHTEVLVSERHSQLTRWANSEIHQNVAEFDTEVRVRVVEDGRVGVASTNDLSEGSLRALTERARMLARYAPPSPHVGPLTAPVAVSANPAAFVRATAESTPEARARAAAVICRLAGEAGLLAYGAYEAGWGRMEFANSLGHRAEQRATKTDLNLVVMGDDSTGYASWSGEDVGGIDPEALARVAVEKAVRSRHPQLIDPGTYTVLLEEDAAADLLEQVASAGFGGQEYADGTSFVSGRMGDRLFHESVTIWDDPESVGMLPMTFDAAGTPKRRITLIDRGVALGVVHDASTAHQVGAASTGHARPTPGSRPLPSRVRMAEGTETKEQLLKKIDRGIWVTRFHYTNLAEPHTATITGMTRDGTFLIEHGEITRPLKNLRFTSGGIEALNRLIGIGKDSKLTVGWSGASRAPALAVEGFRFTGVTRF